MNYEKWVFHDVMPIYIQLYEKLLHSIFSGKLHLGEDIPPIRQMATFLHINANTVAKSYRLVSQQDLIIRSEGRGYKVTFNALIIQQKRYEQRQILCCTYIRRMLELGYTKKEAIDSISQFLANQLNCGKEKD